MGPKRALGPMPELRPRSQPVLDLRWSAEPADDRTADCGWPWLGHDSWCYFTSREEAGWQEASSACRSLDGSLVTVSDAAIERLLEQILTDR